MAPVGGRPYNRRSRMGLDLRDLLRDHLVVHPRIAAQPEIVEATKGARLAAELPPLVPFGGAQYVGGDWILDWDHRLPSKQSILRLSAYYTEERRKMAQAARDLRLSEIKREDL